MILQPVDHPQPVGGRNLREHLLASILDETRGGTVEQFGPAPDQVVQILARFMAFWHGQFLCNMQQFLARGFQLFGDIGAVEQFKWRNPLHTQPVFEQAAHFFAGCAAIKILRADANRIGLGGELELLDGFADPFVQHRGACELAAFAIEDFLGDSDGGDLVAGQHVLGHLHRLFAAF